MSWIIFGAVVLLALLLAANWLANADPKTLARALKWLGVGVLALFASWFVLSGRALVLVPLLLFGLPFLRRRALAGLRGINPFQWGQAPSRGQCSNVETATVRMTLDHDSGGIEGEVIRGPLAGRPFATLSMADLVGLRDECVTDDGESVPLIEAYLDRSWPDWRAGESRGANGEGAAADSGAPMSEREAWGVLDLEPGASHEDIKAAHHRLMKKLHPDQGGSTYLATKINQAKELLLRH